MSSRSRSPTILDAHVRVKTSNLGLKCCYWVTATLRSFQIAQLVNIVKTHFRHTVQELNTGTKTPDEQYV